MNVTIARKKLVLALVWVLAAPALVVSQAEQSLTLQGKVGGEFRSNISRLPGYLDEEDYRANFFLTAGKQWPLSPQGKLSLSYELRHYRYTEYKDFTRYDHSGRSVFQTMLGSQVKLTASDEIRWRSHPIAERFNYRRIVFNIYARKNFGALYTMTLGYQNWIKSYPRNAALRNYQSHRVFVTISRDFSPNTNISGRLEYQEHRGNLYPGSTAPEQSLRVSGDRLVLNLGLDKIFGRKLIANFVYRVELDRADDFKMQQNGEHSDDEDTEEFLSDDSDFGYLKNQAALSAVLKMNARFSLVIFDLLYDKRFQYWQITPAGPLRHDRLIFLSHTLKIRLSDRFSFDIRQNYEHNLTNLDFYKYKINSAALGLSFAF